MRIFTSVFFLLLAYTVAALVFWSISLQRQNKQILAQEVIILNGAMDSTQQPQEYAARLKDLQNNYQSHVKQFVGESITFMLVILIGASVVFSFFRRRLILSRQQNNFMMAVTHELKSPLAAMKLSLQTLQKHQLTEDKRHQLVDRCISESDRLNSLCSNILFASQLEGHKYVPNMERLNFTELVDDCVKDYAHRYPRSFQEDIELNCKIFGDRVQLQMAVNNLLENAVKYSPADTAIAVQLGIQSKNAVLHVVDNGPGVPAEEKKEIFNKFYRVGNEDNRKTKGTGLGLYLTSKIIKQHRGKIGVKDNPEGGAIFEVCLPLV